jgi:hypothetical protein
VHLNTCLKSCCQTTGTYTSILLGGSTEHRLKINRIFDVGCLTRVMLVDRVPTELVGYDIISAGRLRHLRTVQCSTDSFYVVDSDNYVVSGGIIGSDTIFYLTDKNLLLDKPPVGSKKRLVNMSIDSENKMIHQRLSADHLEGVKKMNTPYIQQNFNSKHSKIVNHIPGESIN